MALIAKKQDKFYDEGGSGGNAPDAALLAQAKEIKDQVKGEGHKMVLADRIMGPFMVNLQHASDDVDELRRYVEDPDEIINAAKSTFPFGCYYDGTLSRWCIAITATEFMGMQEEFKIAGEFWGWNKNIGAKDSTTNNMIVEKVIPIGFRVFKVIVFGSNAGGTGSESKFTSFIGTISAPTNTPAGASSNTPVNLGVEQAMDSGVNVDGDGVKTIRLNADLSGDKNDVIYGGLIQLTQI